MEENAINEQGEKEDVQNLEENLEAEFEILAGYLHKCKGLLKSKVTVKMYPTKGETDDAISCLHRIVDINPDITNDIQLISEFASYARERKWKKVKSTVLSACMEFDIAQTKYLSTEVKSALDRPSSIELANFDIWKECAYLRFGTDISDTLDPEIIEEHIEQSLPTQMATQFCSIYDKEWTEAIQQVLSTLGDENEENELLKDVSDILKMLFDYFKDKVDIQVKNMCSVMAKVAFEPIQIKPKSRASKIVQTSRSTVPSDHERDEVRKYARLTVQGTSHHTIPILLKDFSAQTQKKYKIYFNIDKFVKLIDKCAYFSWSINLMNPPMVLLWAENVTSEKLFHYFRYFTKFGTELEFCVWPSLLLQFDGQVFVRGVAQLK